MLKEKIISKMVVSINGCNIDYNARVGVIKKVISKKDNKEKIIYIPSENIYKLFDGTYAEKGKDEAFRKIDISLLGIIVTKNNGIDDERIISVREVKNKENYKEEADKILESFIRR